MPPLKQYKYSFVSLIIFILNIMSRDELMKQFDDLSPTKIQPKQFSNDLGALLSMQFQYSKPNSTSLAKKKYRDQDRHQYLIQAQKGNDKIKKNIQKLMAQKSLTASQFKQKREIQRVALGFNRLQKQIDKFQTTSKKKYMPTIVDPFAKANKPQEKSAQKSKGNVSKIVAQFSKKYQADKSGDKISKREQKVEKVNRKQKQRQKTVREEQKRKHQKQALLKSKTEKDSSFTKALQPNSSNYERIKRKQQASKYSSPLSESSQENSQMEESSDNWRKQLRKVTNYDPSAPKFKELDRKDIIESGLDKIFKQDRRSHRLGLMQQQEDLRRQQQYNKKKQARQTKQKNK